ncbi:hypothetical protein ANCCAN_24233 [Ancylostoma caninum]|uniref:PABS domain-containing protein n=1 Tax=Ancylostoma caninum TaxID=29170 RepID=A0A368FGK8_ANCCA|nr:hypothetical protein ANCCAN_24233 [Ancylostoma caninum]
MRRSVARVIEAPQIDAYTAVHSYFRLLLPKNLSKNNIDTKKWKIDHDHLLPGSFYHIAAETIFYSDGVRLSRDSDAVVLVIGLGGGMINGFLHHNFPKMNITVVEISVRFATMASKWFDLKLDRLHSVALTDGSKFVKIQAKKG